MPKRSSKVRSALENLGQHAKKRKFSAQADKENKCPTVDTTIPVLASHHKGLNGSQAVWAAKKYRGHRVLPGSIFTELDAAHI
ncbi:hypothetical protein EDB19DRAFT_1941970, partial [Suillus lakei]